MQNLRILKKILLDENFQRLMISSAMVGGSLNKLQEAPYFSINTCIAIGFITCGIYYTSYYFNKFNNETVQSVVTTIFEEGRQNMIIRIIQRRAEIIERTIRTVLESEQEGQNEDMNTIPITNLDTITQQPVVTRNRAHTL